MPLAYKTRKRDLPPPTVGYRTKRIYQDPQGNRFPVPAESFGPTTYKWPGKCKGIQITGSESHPEWFSRKKRPFGDIGGPFRTERRYVVSEGNPPSHVVLSTNTVDYLGRPSGSFLYEGECYPIDPNHLAVAFELAPESSNGLLINLGTEAIASVKPTNTIADLATALGELYREGLPKAIGSSIWEKKARSGLKKPANEYLNIEFGWKPIAADIEDFFQGVFTADAVMKQYERDAGRVVRRGYEFPTFESVNETTVLSGTRVWLPVSATYLDAPEPYSGQVVRKVELSRRRWFSGAFTYFLPKDYKSRKQMSRIAGYAQQVFGTQLTPETVWNLTPWSWAVDWVSNTGDVISNLTDWAQHGLVLKYGYMMEHSRATVTYTYMGGNHHKGGYPQAGPLILVHEVKKRIQATPFGFGLNWEAFSPRQLAILTALGITRR